MNYDIRQHAVTNKSRYGNTYIFTLGNHKIECRGGKPAALDVSLGNVSVQVNIESIQKLREIVRANLPEFRSMVKSPASAWQRSAVARRSRDALAQRVI